MISFIGMQDRSIILNKIYNTKKSAVKIGIFHGTQKIIRPLNLQKQTYYDKLLRIILEPLVLKKSLQLNERCFNTNSKKLPLIAKR